MTDVTLVIMAAGLGSRYGGLKQIDSVGPSGEFLMEYSIYDALRAGFNRVVFVVQPGMVANLRQLCGDRISRYVDVTYVNQDISLVPAFYAVPAKRTKPFGTVQALLSVRDVVSGPFVILNADDFYGLAAFRHMYCVVCDLTASGEACMPGYWLKNTLSSYGSVSRGICNVQYKHLVRIREERNLLRLPDGSIRSTCSNNSFMSVPIDLHTIVSMNFWGFTPWIFNQAEKYFHKFLSSLSPTDLESECILSSMIDYMVSQKELSVSVLPTDSQWFGITYAADKQNVQSELQKLIAAGAYPRKLFI